MSVLRILLLLFVYSTSISAECNCSCANDQSPKTREQYMEPQVEPESSGLEIVQEELTTTAKPSTTTTEDITRRPISNPASIPLQPLFEEEPFVCVPNAPCYKDADCDGGRCVGLAVGTCKCNCFSFMMCGSDKGCGGLRGSCNLRNYKCDCLSAYTKNGFVSLFQALATFCNIKQCDGENFERECFGMPCNAGQCMC